MQDMELGQCPVDLPFRCVNRLLKGIAFGKTVVNRPISWGWFWFSHGQRSFEKSDYCTNHQKFPRAMYEPGKPNAINRLHLGMVESQEFLSQLAGLWLLAILVKQLDPGKTVSVPALGNAVGVATVFINRGMLTYSLTFISWDVTWYNPSYCGYIAPYKWNCSFLLYGVP